MPLLRADWTAPRRKASRLPAPLWRSRNCGCLAGLKALSLAAYLSPIASVIMYGITGLVLVLAPCPDSGAHAILLTTSPFPNLRSQLRAARLACLSA
jgi:hypothetical protein